MTSVFIQEKNKNISPFTVLLATISSQLHADDVKRICTQLHGLINKECLDTIHDGRSLLAVLQKRGLLNSKKLSLLRKSLLDSNLSCLVDLLDDFKKEAVQQSNVSEGKGAMDSVASQGKDQREKTLQQVLGRQQNEISNCFDTGKNIRRKLEGAKALLERQKQAVVIEEDAKENLFERMQIENAERDHIEETLLECQAVIAMEEKQLKDVLFQLRNGTTDKNKLSGFSSSPRRERRMSIIELEEKNRKAIALKKQSEERQTALSLARVNERDLRKSLEIRKNSVRSLNLAILKKTDELISMDQLLLKTLEDIRQLKKAIRQNEFDLFDIQRELEETEEEITRTKKGIHVQFSKPKLAIWKSKEKHKRDPMLRVSSLEVLGYAGVTDERSYSFGELGSRADPPQFNFPCCVAVGWKKDIFVADYMNRRIHVLDETGGPSREPLELGNTFPVAMAVNKRGNIFITDSQILKVFSSNGALSYNFLPVYGKKDLRPKISALAVDKEGNVFIADQSNHRIQKFRMDGHFVGFIGGPQYLDSPSGVTVTNNGDVIVSELNACQLKIFNYLGTSCDVVGKPGIGKACFGNPRGLALDSRGNILVADTANHRIQVLTPEGEYIDSLGRLGSSPGCLDSPYAVAVNRSDHVIVADAGNHRITVFT